MHITLQRDEFIKPLSYVVGAVEKRQTLPILSFILFRQKKNEITLTGTDLEVEIVTRVKNDGDSDIEFTLPARKLLDICRALPPGAVIEISKDGEKIVVKSGRSRFSLLTLPAEDFPNIQIDKWDQTLSIDQNVLKSLLMQTNFCMAQQDMRYFLNGLLFDMGDGKIRVVGTDGHRMALSESALSNSDKEATLKQVILPRKGVHEMIRLLDDSPGIIEIHMTSNHIQVSAPTFTFTSKLIDGKYPDYTKVIPAAQSNNVRVDRESIREALGRTAILSNEKYRGARFSIAGKGMKISTHNPEQEEAIEEITVNYTGEPIEIGFNVSYVIDVINALQSEEIIIGLTDANSSCTIHSPDSKQQLYVIMPMRL